MRQDRAGVIEWLMEGDPSIRWQVLRDLEGAAEPVWKAEQDRVAAEGWDARLLEHQDEHGRWTPRLYGKKWISTTYTIVLLRSMGLARSEPRAIKACGLFLDEALGADGCINTSPNQPRSLRTGEIVNPQFLRLSFSPHWHHDVLRTLDYFYAAGSLDDIRLQDAIDVVEKKRDEDGRWPLQQLWPGETWFEMETVGEPSRWNTLRAMRALEARRAGQPDSI